MIFDSVHIGDTIKLRHAKYGNLHWTVINLTDEAITLWCEMLPDFKPFCAPESATRFLRLDMGGTGKKIGAQPQGVLRDDIQQLTLQQINYILDQEDEAESSGSDIRLDGSSLRSAHLATYGCNQWPVSSLRTWLNGEFLQGMSSEDRARILPITSDIVLSSSKAKRDIQNAINLPNLQCAEIPYDSNTSLYDKYIITSQTPYTITSGKRRGEASQYINYARLTHARITDLISIPSKSMFALCREYFANAENFKRPLGGKLPYYWLMDADYKQAAFPESIVELMIFVTSGIDGAYRTKIDSCNARAAQGVCPVMSLRRNID